ncbi:MAG: cell surface protein SprA [Saprospiraceae bacterium]|nr:cell surface protein SprA [Saprospiraceae bacterium]
MEKTIRYILKSFSLIFLLLIVFETTAVIGNIDDNYYHAQILPTPPDTALPYPIPQTGGNPHNTGGGSGLYLKDPKNINSGYVYDPETNQYIFTNKIGSLDYTPPTYMTFEEFLEYDMEKSLRKYWDDRADASGNDNRRGLIPQLHVGGEVFDRIFGSSTIDIRPQGSAELIFGVLANRRDDPALDVKQRKTANFDFNMKIQMNVMAKIGDKIEFGVNYNTEATFEFDNKMKLQYEGKEDEILQLVEAGDVTLPLNGTLITGSTALFGVKTKLQFGKTTVTSIFSQQKSETSNITVADGAQTSDFYIKADEYEENKHFFLAQYFRDHYNEALERLPVVNSAINITKIEVWLTNIGAPTTENRNIVAFLDIGEKDTIYNTSVIHPNFQYPYHYPKNDANDLLTFQMDINQLRNINTVSSYLSNSPFGFTAGIDFEKVENARKLNPTEYTLNSKLGFISLNTRLNSDQVLAVAYQYTVIGLDSVFQVGEFSNGGINAPNCLAVKLLKSTALNTQTPIWDLMMKNVYSIGAYQVNSEDFRLNILYEDDKNGVPTGFITEGAISGQPLIRAMNLDKLNTLLDPVPDGVFDFIDGASTNGGTVQSSNGRIYFPTVEPFGLDLRKAIDPGNPNSTLAKKYAFDELYNSTKNEALQHPEKNRFALEGMYKSAAGSEISLNAMNVPKGSVKVTAGGVVLTENVDYTVDYTLGRVKIINEGYLNSGTPINISLESNSLFAIQTKTLLGTHIDYKVNNDFYLGATILNLTERPLTQKINFGDEPISNTIWGLDGTYQTESRLLTKLVDKIPFIDTKVPSKITVNGEFAQLIPGHARAIGKTGTSYIDDFEGSSSAIDMKNIGTWFLASTPQGQMGLFPEAELDNNLAYGFNRAKLAWYVIDPLFVRNNNVTPQHIKDDPNQQSNHFVREVLEVEVFPNKEPVNGQVSNIAVLDVSFYPNERGPYNYDVDGGSFSSGLNPDGTLKDAPSRWGGIMREIETTDFESTNIEYIEFWMMDPFIYDPNHPGGELYFNLGDISEDILKDGRKSYENGLPTSNVVSNVDTTIWGRVPTLQALVSSFDNNADSREYQDVGLDGLMDADEATFFGTTYIDKIANSAGLGTASQAYQNAVNDPSGDNYHYFRGGDYDKVELSILERYKMYNGMDGNSPTDKQSPEKSYPTSATSLPNIEDINLDNTLSDVERYYQYRVDLRPNKMNIGENYITDIQPASVTLKNGTHATVNWYQFKIPIQSPDKVVGLIQDFKSIRFMRMYMRNFSEPVHCRFATLELVKGEWRKYRYSLLYPGEYIPDDNQSLTTFDITTINIEENGKRYPVPYVLPPDIEREINIGTTNLSKLNEQSLVLKVCNLLDGDARAGYKTTDFDFRRYKKLKMFVHAEEIAPDIQPTKDGEVSVFIRLGTDFTNNYYEYEIPLTFTSWGTSAINDQLIWPDANSLDLELKKLVDAKQARNILMREGNTSISITTPYIVPDGKNTITVVGTPNLSSVKTIMIGVRNPKKQKISDGDDGLEKCAEVWVNELRLTDFDEKGGWAATARVAADLADFGNVIIAGNISTPGFGSIEKKVNERQTEQITQYDIATNLELGKFFPEKIGLKIPMHFDYSEMTSNPEFNPLNPDVKFKEDLQTYSDLNERDSIKKLSQDYIRRKSINFINVKKNRVGTEKKPRIYSIENFDVTYSYNEIFQRNIDIEYNLKKKYMGAIGYNYSTNPKNVKPFNKNKFLGKHKSLALIRDFNFFYAPKMLSFRTDLDREYNESLMRNKSNAIVILEPTYIKTFTWNRMYDLKYDLTQALKIDFRATVNARVDEPPGKIDKADSEYDAKMDTIWDNIMDLGRITTYNQIANVNYNIPINKIPFLNWLNASAKYGSIYTWNAAPTSATDLGNTIENSNTKQINGNANMTNLYNKVGYLKKLNLEKRQPKNNSRGRGGVNEKEQEIEDEENDTLVEKVNIAKEIFDNSLMVLTGIRNISFSYSESNGTYLPGFLHSPDIMGMDLNNQSPGWEFIFGSQKDITRKAIDNNWISKEPELNTAYATKYSQNLSARSTIEPFQGFRIELTANRTYSQNYSAYIKYDSLLGGFGGSPYSPMSNGSFSISWNTWGTAFMKDKDDYSSEAFDQFKEYLITIANRLAEENPNWNKTFITDSISGVLYPDGYSSTSQDVMIPAFLAAYAGSDAKSMSLDPFPKIPKPNWRITFTGLSDIKIVKKYFKNVTLGHGYRSMYNVGSYASNVNYKEQDGFTYIRDELGNNYLPKYEINQISISEQFSPLINIDATLHNSLTAKFEIKKSRNLALSFANNQLTEVNSKEFIIGGGYRIKEVPFTINTRGIRKRIKSDLNLKADFSIRSNKTVLRKLVENVDQISAGQRIISINFSADYMINQRLNIRLFYDMIINNPFVSSQFPNSNTHGGISLRFSLAQ